LDLLLFGLSGEAYMALIKCPECKNEISDKAIFCPRCGYPMTGHGNEAQRTAPIGRKFTALIAVFALLSTAGAIMMVASMSMGAPVLVLGVILLQVSVLLALWGRK
jgi:hypothetical protein